MKTERPLPVPEEVESYFSELRIRLAYRISVIFLLVFILLTFAYYYDSLESFYTMALGVVVSAICLYIIHHRKNYRLVFGIYSICGVLVTSYALISFHETIHLVDVLWMLAAVSLGFFGIGRKLGIVLLIVAICAIIVFICCSLNKNIVTVKPRNAYQLITLVAEMISGFFVNFYLFYLFLDINKFSEKKLLESNQRLQEQNERVRVQNDEKTTLVKEVHHRVKNNLQIVVSLLRMQSQEIANPELKSVFQESISRVMAMSLIHQKLYQNNQLNKINVKEYFTDLIDEMLRLNYTGKQIQADMDIEMNSIGLKSLVPLGLIINELVSNSLKHAFTDRHEGCLKLTINSVEDDWLEVTYADNGSWKNRTSTEASFGLTLIETLTEQLEGSVDLRNGESGTVYYFRLKNLEENELGIH